MRGLAVALALVVLAGCTERIDTPIVFDLPINCEADPQGSTVDTYSITLFAMDDPTRRCLECVMSLIDGPPICQVHSTYCFCGPEANATTMALTQQLVAAQIEGIDPELVFCLNVVALDTTRNEPGGSLVSCECPDPLDATARVCALSSVGAVNEAGVPITIPQAACDPSPSFQRCSLMANR